MWQVAYLWQSIVEVEAINFIGDKQKGGILKESCVAVQMGCFIGCA
jgi:hypothetical protein